MIVVDASLAVKWFLEEPLSDAAGEILTAHAGEINVPDVMLVEVVGALVRNANMVKASRPNILAALNRFDTLLADGDLVAHRSPRQNIRKCADMAIEIGHPLKDCIYLVLAMEYDCYLVTCDAKFAAKAKNVWPKVRVLGEL
ncbi:MAG: type II toxin-antitoxin system VapC family toxin [Sphingopyxis sp.]